MNTISNNINILFDYNPFTSEYIFLYKHHVFPALQENFIPLREKIMTEHVYNLLENVNKDFDTFVKENPDDPVLISYYIVKASCGAVIGSKTEANKLMSDFSESYAVEGHLNLQKIPVLFTIWKCLHMLRLFRKFNWIKFIFMPLETIIEFMFDPFNEKEFGLVIKLAKKIVLLIWSDRKYLRNKDKIYLIKIFYYYIKEKDPFYDWCFDRLDDWLKKNKDFGKNF